jgi:putative ABC transport system permease protein
MINKLVLENLKHRWLRTLLSALVVGVQVMLILTLVGLSRGLLQTSADRAKGSGADIFLKPDTQGTITFASGQVSEKFVDFVRKQPHVTQAMGVLSQVAVLTTAVNGVNIEELNRMSGGLHYLAGGPLKGPDDLIIDDYYQRENKKQVGDTVKLLNHNWKVCGVVQSGVLGRLIVSLATLQALTGNLNPPRVSEILVKVDNPARTREVVDELNRLLAGNLKAISTTDFVSQFTVSSIPQLQAFIRVITVVTVFVELLVVFLTMYTAVVERTREIGILKALGAKPLTILDILVRESVVLAIVGCVLGILLSFGARALIMSLAPASLTVINVPDWWPKAAAIALAGALLGAIYPGMKAARQDAIEALSYE